MEDKEMKVLLADDEKPIAYLYETGLFGYLGGKADRDMADLEAELFGSSESSDDPVQVQVCRQGADAVELAKQARADGEPFDVIVLDIRMPPGIDGVEAAERIREFDPAVPIIFVSGYSDYSVPDFHERVPPPHMVHYLQKPIGLQQLARKIQEAAT